MPPLVEEGSDLDALWKAFVMIVVSEIGDKTFLIAAIMATRHARITVFGGAFTSLVVMSVLSAAMGRVVLGLVPKVWTQWAAAILFLVFGIKLLQEALKMSSGTSHIQDEMREVEEELEEDASTYDPSNPTNGTIPLEALEEGKSGLSLDHPISSPPSPKRRSTSTHTREASSSPIPNGIGLGSRPDISFGSSSGLTPGSGSGSAKGGMRKKQHWLVRTKNGTRNFLQLATNPVFAQAFVLTFLGEWGDRSQIATIALGGAHSIPVIAFGTILGHGLCTLGAVMGGRYLSTKISVKHISLIGATAFLIFAFLYAYEAYYSPSESIDTANKVMKDIVWR